MKSPKDKARYRQWRIDNPEKVREQRKRRYARKVGALAPFVKPEKLSAEEVHRRDLERKKREYQKRKARLASDPVYAAEFRRKEQERAAKRYAKLLADPVALAAKREQELERKRQLSRAKGIQPRKPAMSKSEYLAHRRERNRLKLRRERGLPDDYVFPKSPPRFTKSGEKLPPREKRPTSKDRIAIERARRAAEVSNAKARYPSSQPQVIESPDPPELVALFKKASKGEPPRPTPITFKKKTAFQIRGWM